MSPSPRAISLVFAAGCLGGLANSLAVWAFGQADITAALGVKLAPALTAPWLYPRIVWGGMWGLLFLLPVFGRSPFKQGAFMSLGPSAVMLFVVFPLQMGQGQMGLELGTLTPLFVLFYNAVWGITAAFWLRLSK